MEEIQNRVRESTLAELDEKIQKSKAKGPIGIIRKYELVFQNILMGFEIPEDVNDSVFDKPEQLEEIKSNTKTAIEETSLNENEIVLFNSFVDVLAKDDKLMDKYKEMLDKAHQEEPLYLYDTVNDVVTRLMDA